MSGNNWILEPISNAAKKNAIQFGLKQGENLVGKTKTSYIRIPSLLCSRSHCNIILHDDKVLLKDNSRNGTYVNHASNGETNHYLNNVEEATIEHKDVISFGFNICSVYERDEKHIFMYRLLKKPIVTISLDSDDETQEQPVEPNNEPIELDSESDVYDSGDECFKNIDDIENDDSDIYDSSSDYSEEFILDDDSVNSDESSESNESDLFVVTKTIFNPKEDEVHAIDGEEDNEICDENIIQSDQVSESHQNVNENGTPKEAEKIPIKTNEENDDESTENDENNEEKPNNTTESITLSEKLEKVKRKVAERLQKTIKVTTAQPIRKRRKTMTEEDYHQQKAVKLSIDEKNARAYKLRQIEESKKAMKDTFGEHSNDVTRIPFVPKVKNTPVSRANLLSTDMMASGTK